MVQDRGWRRGVLKESKGFWLREYWFERVRVRAV
jgi:hypothetical protein